MNTPTHTDRLETKVKQLPNDIRQVYTAMKWMHDDLSDTMMESVDEWMQELRATFKEWRNNTDPDAIEPDWDVYRQWMNDITDDDGSPQLLFIA